MENYLIAYETPYVVDSGGRIIYSALDWQANIIIGIFAIALAALIFMLARNILK